MKTDVHPNYYVAQVSCACGASFVTRSTRKEIKLEICSACHPFYTGKQRLVDTAGRVERFQKRFAKTEGKTVKREATESRVKKLESMATQAGTKKKVLSTAPKQAEPKAKAKTQEKKEPKKSA